MLKPTPEAAYIASISITVQLLVALEKKGVFSANEIDTLLTDAYLGQSDVGGIPRSELNARAQDLITRVLKGLQEDRDLPPA